MTIRRRRPIHVSRKAVTISARANEIRQIQTLRALAAEQGRRVVIKPKGQKS